MKVDTIGDGGQWNFSGMIIERFPLSLVNPRLRTGRGEGEEVRLPFHLESMMILSPISQSINKEYRSFPPSGWGICIYILISRFDSQLW